MPTHQQARTAAVFALSALLLATAVPAQNLAPDITPDEIRAIAADAFVYGFPVVDNMRVQYAYFQDSTNPEYKAPRNILFNIPRVFTPEDTAIQTPNSDTPYSWIGLDLRAEPIVFTVPPIPADRYWSLQLIDLYTYNFAYLGSRATGNDGGSFAIAGPGWQGALPAGIEQVIHTETDILSAQFRTQLFGPDDLDNVIAVQNQYLVQPLSAFLGQPAPPQPAPLDWPVPLSPADQKTSPEFFNLLNFGLQFAPPVAAETDLRARFARIGIVPGTLIDFAAMTADQRQAFTDGMADGWARFEGLAQEVNTGAVTSGDMFGTRDYLDGNYLYRMGAAVLGIYGNSREEAIYPAYYVDSNGDPLSGARKYTLRFAPGQEPPVNSFWSLTMYEQPTSLLVANPINRYLLNSPMADNFVRDADGGLTIYIQHDAPEAGLQPNWLPAPDGPFSTIMRLYWPKPEALDGTWTAPALTPVN